MLSFSLLPTIEKLQQTYMPWRSTTKGESKGTITLQAWAINHEAGRGDLKAVLTYNGIQAHHIHVSMVVCLDTNFVDVGRDLHDLDTHNF